MHSVEMDRLSVGYGKAAVLHDVSASLSAGIHCVLGPNGAGKTTLFRALAGILRPAGGSVLIDGAQPHSNAGLRSEIGYIAHRPALHPRLSAGENLEFWARARGFRGSALAEAMTRAARETGLDAFLGTRASALSRGQAQRVAIARCLLSAPRLMLLDEPTSGLDPASARAFSALLRECAVAGCVVIFATHNLYEANYAAESYLVLRNGTARHIRKDSPELAGSVDTVADRLYEIIQN